MNSTYLNAKCKGILRKLLNNNSYLSLQQLAEELNISQRSIYYDVCRINEWLSENDIPELRVVRGKGLLLSEQIRIPNVWRKKIQRRHMFIRRWSECRLLSAASYILRNQCM